MQNKTNNEITKAYIDSPFYPYVVDTNAVYKCDKDNIPQPISKYMRISTVFDYVDEDKEELQLEYFSSNRLRQTIISRFDLTKRNFYSLAGRGVDITDSNVVDLTNYLRKTLDTAVVQRIHSHLGWNFNGIKTYRLHHCVGGDSIYLGTTDVKPTGSLENWMNMIHTQVEGNIPMETCLVAGFTAIFVPLLNNISQVDTLLFHLMGDSSCGKTTAEILALSSFGKPSMVNGLMSTWVDTPNAIMATIGNKIGVPVAFDESSSSTLSDFTPIIYQMSQGKEKGRMCSSFTLKNPSKWSTTVLSSGESSLLSGDNQNTGLRVRLIELGGLKFTTSANNSNVIKQICLQNYGHAAPILAEYLMGISNEELQFKFNDLHKRLLETYSHKDNFVERTVSRIAIFVITAHYVNLALGLNLNEDAIGQLLVNADEKSMDCRDLGEKALDFIREFYIINADKFKDNNNPLNAVSTSQSIGNVTKSDQFTEICILKNKLDSVLKNSGFTNVQEVMKKLKAKGFLDCDADRYTRMRKVSDTKTLVYVIKLPR